ncbi:hypothetical protein BJ546DRAFT_366404 [Cryomyces antarcticus]
MLFSIPRYLQVLIVCALKTSYSAVWSRGNQGRVIQNTSVDWAHSSSQKDFPVCAASSIGDETQPTSKMAIEAFKQSNNTVPTQVYNGTPFSSVPASFFNLNSSVSPSQTAFLHPRFPHIHFFTLNPPHLLPHTHFITPSSNYLVFVN